MKTTKKFFTKLVVLLLLLLLLSAFALASCSSNNISDGNDDENTTDYGEEDVRQSIYPVTVPAEITLNGATYNLDSDFTENNITVAGGTYIGYLVNRVDYETFYAQEPDLIYAVDENNTVVDIGNDNRVPIYSLAGYNIEYCIGVVTDTHVYVNGDYIMED